MINFDVIHSNEWMNYKLWTTSYGSKYQPVYKTGSFLQSVACQTSFRTEFQNRLNSPSWNYFLTAKL